MARIVKRTEHGPAQVTTDGKPIFVCRCGLSKNPHGLCDGSHTKTLDEPESKTFVYGESGERVEI